MRALIIYAVAIWIAVSLACYVFDVKELSARTFDDKRYCLMVYQQAWPDYNETYTEMCVDGRLRDDN